MQWQKYALESSLSLITGRPVPRPAEHQIEDLSLEGIIHDGFNWYLVDTSLVQQIRGAARERIQELAKSCTTGVLTQWKLAARLEELARSCYLALDSRAELVYLLWKRVHFLRDKEKQQATIDAVVSTIRSHFNLD